MNAERTNEKGLDDSLFTNVLNIPNVGKVKWKRFWHFWTETHGEGDAVVALLQHVHSLHLAATWKRGGSLKDRRGWKLYGERSPSTMPITFASPSPVLISPAETQHVAEFVHTPGQTPKLTPGHMGLTPNVGFTPFGFTPLPHTPEQSFIPSQPQGNSPCQPQGNSPGQHLNSPQPPRNSDYLLSLLQGEGSLFPADNVREVWVFNLLPNTHLLSDLSKFPGVEEFDQGEFDLGSEVDPVVLERFQQATTDLFTYSLGPKLHAVKLANRLVLLHQDSKCVQFLQMDTFYSQSGLTISPTIHTTMDGLKLRRLAEEDLFGMEAIRVLLSPYNTVGIIDPEEQVYIHSSLANPIFIDSDEDAGDAQVLTEWMHVFNLPDSKVWFPLPRLAQQNWHFKTVIVRLPDSETRIRIPACCVFVPTTALPEGDATVKPVPRIISDLAERLIQDEVENLLAPARTLGELQAFAYGQNGWKDLLHAVDGNLDDVYKDLDQESLRQRIVEDYALQTEPLEMDLVASPQESDRGEVFGLLEALESHKDLVDPHPRRSSIIHFDRPDEDDLKLTAVRDDDWDWFGNQASQPVSSLANATPMDELVVPSAIVEAPSPQGVVESPRVQLDNDAWAPLHIPKEFDTKANYELLYEPRHRESSLDICEHHVPVATPVEFEETYYPEPVKSNIQSAACWFLQHHDDVAVASLESTTEHEVGAVDALLAATGFVHLELARECFMNQFVFASGFPLDEDVDQVGMELKWVFAFRRALESSLNLEQIRGPLKVQQLVEAEPQKTKLQLSIKKKIKGKETAPFSQLSLPHLVVGRADLLIGMTSDFVPHWNKLGVKPRCGAKDVKYFCLFPCGLAPSWNVVKAMAPTLTTKPLAEACATWMTDLSAEYQSHHLGLHAPMDQKFSKGLVPVTCVPEGQTDGLLDTHGRIIEAYKNVLERLASWFASNPGTFFNRGLGSQTKRNRFLVVYIVDPTSLVGGHGMVVNEFASTTCRLWWDLTRLYVAFFLQPLVIASGLDMQTVATRCVLHLVPLGDLYKTQTREAAFSVYQKCRIPMWRSASFASMYAPAMTIASDATNPTAAMGVLAPHFFFRNAKKTMDSHTPLTDSSFNVLEPDRMVHIVYSIQETGLVDWASVCVHDAVGELLNVFVVESELVLVQGKRERQLDLMGKMFDKTLQVLGYGGGLKWRIVIGKLGRLLVDEVERWKLVFSRLMESFSGLVDDLGLEAINSVSLVSFDCSSGLKVFFGGKYDVQGDETSCSLVGIAPRVSLGQHASWSSGWLVTLPISQNLVSSTDVALLQSSLPMGAPVYAAQVDLWWHANRLVDPVLTNFAPWGKPEDGQASHVVCVAILRDVLRNYHALRFLDSEHPFRPSDVYFAEEGLNFRGCYSSVTGESDDGRQDGQVGLETTGQWRMEMLPFPFKIICRVSRGLLFGKVLH
jgi:hypothetical protein